MKEVRENVKLFFLIIILLMIFSSCSIFNKEPIANAGGDQTVVLGDTVYLDGSNSYDPDGDNLKYAWSFNSKPYNSSLYDGDINSRISSQANFIPDKTGNYELQLKVTDPSKKSDTDLVTITVGDSGGTIDVGIQ